MTNQRAPSRQPDADPLRVYKSKRDFARTPEPAGATGHVATTAGVAAAHTLTFVVQKHWASSLHYDFRLELDGVMKSWAVPKGPSLDPTVKRMAIQVEDHPLSYAGFEGTVPAKQYGAGEVIVWDAGTWTALHDAHQGLGSGHLKFKLHGHKLHGNWVLVRMKGQGEKQAPWLLMKDNDTFARAAAEFSVVDDMPASVKSFGAARVATVDSIANAQLNLSAAGKPEVKSKLNPIARPISVVDLPPEAVPSPLPPALSPQLATLAADLPPEAAAWLYEIKFDGYRMLLRNDASGARLFTRNGLDWTAKFQSLQSEFEQLNLPPGWYDGEIVVPNDAGVPDFGALQQAVENQRTDAVVFYLFDLPYAAGNDLRSAPLDARRAVLEQLLCAAASAHIRFSEAFNAAPDNLLASACKLGLEGVMAKRRSSPYQSVRCAHWIKLKCSQRQEFVIGGYTEPQGSRFGPGALCVGVHDAHGELQYAGDVGTGFSQKTLADLKTKLEAMPRKTSPFADESVSEIAPNKQRKVHWVTPALVAEVSFAKWTRAGRIRHAVFCGLRSDKPAREVVRETAQPVANQNSPAEKPLSKPPPHHSPPLSTRLEVTHPQRLIDARTGTTKIDLISYYARVAELMLPHLAGRPVSLLRAPDGVEGDHFFQKHAITTKLPGMRQLDPSLSVGHLPLMAVTGKRGVLSAAQWNVIEFHTMNAVSTSFAQPDRMVFDLDPGAGVAWAQVQEAAQLVQAFLMQLGLTSFLKTSGGKGLHVLVPLRRMHSWDAVKGVSEAVVLHMAKTITQRFVARSGPKNRVGKIFIDYLRNGLGATTVCAWSARARPGLGISVPVDWSELPSLRGGDHWTIDNVHQRLDVGNAPWAGYAKAARGLGHVMVALGLAKRQS